MAAVKTPIPTPSAEAARTALPPPRRLRRGLEGWLYGWQGRWRRRGAVKAEWRQLADAATAEMERCGELPEMELTQLLAERRAAIRRRQKLPSDQLAVVLGSVAEAARRHTGLKAHPNQLMGAIGLWRGALVEMGTGEGKTLTLAMAAMLRGWQGRPCHVVTANDYLARRDARGLRKFFAAGGLEVGYVVSAQETAERRAGYAADICYTTAKELLADLLRDRLVLGPWAAERRRTVGRMQRGLVPEAATVLRGVHCVLVDEADHVLIDEAVTPLIISQPRANADMTAAYEETATFTKSIAAERYEIVVRRQEVELGNELVQQIREEWEPQAAVLKNPRWRLELVRQALRAREFFKRDRHYLIKEGKVVIIDEGTGRPQEQRSWRQGLHQMIEASEGLKLTDPADTLASISFQRFFRQVPVLAGVSGTAIEEAAELWQVYQLPVVPLPPHRPCQRKMHRLSVTARAEERWDQVVATVRRIQATGQPVLVGTRSVAASELVSRRLDALGVPCAVLNARQLEREAQIVSNAGKEGVVTIATNLAGRGTDIRLGKGVVAKGGLMVIATELHGARRIDRQLQGRSGRQGDPGEVRSWACLEDELLRKNLPNWCRQGLVYLIEKNAPGATGCARWSLRWAQRRTGAKLAKQRRELVKQDERMALLLGDGSGSS